MKKCKKVIIDHDTAGQPIYGLDCYCGTTGCEQQFINDFCLQGQKDVLKSLTDDEELLEEKRFYDIKFKD